MNKKNNIILGIAIIIFIAIIALLVINNLKESKALLGEKLEEITYEQVQKKVEKKEDFVIVLSQTTCSHCASYKPILKEITKEKNITIYYLDYDKYDKDTINEILEFFNFDGGTPTTLFFKEGKEISIMSRLVGSVSKTKVIKALEKYEYVKETE